MIELAQDIIEWIELNAKADTSALRLRHAGDRQKNEAILQIECRRKAASKLSDTLKCRNFIFPTALSAEQCTSDILAEFHSTLVKGHKVLDMTCGLCIDAFHIASKGIKVTATDINPEIAEAAVINAKALGLTTVDALCADCTQWLARHDCVFDTIFIDPARRGEGGKRIFALSDCEPDVIALLPLLKQRCRRLIVKASPMLDISSVRHSFGNHSPHIYILGTPTECKELVAVIDFDSEKVCANEITAVTLSHNTQNSFSFTPDEEASYDARYMNAAPGMILYEPYPAAMKSGAFNTMCHRFDTGKLHSNTHFYVSNSIQPGFPGSAMKIIEVMPFGKAACRLVKDKYPVINVTARNFILSSADLAKRLKIKEGGILRLFAVNTVAGPEIIIAAPCNGL